MGVVLKMRQLVQCVCVCVCVRVRVRVRVRVCVCVCVVSSTFVAKTKVEEKK